MWKNTGVTRKISLVHFGGKFGGKKNGIVTNLKFSGWMSYRNSQIIDSCCFGNMNYQIWFCLLNLCISMVKVTIISKVALATNTLMYVHIISGLYQGCPAI